MALVASAIPAMAIEVPVAGSGGTGAPAAPPPPPDAAPAPAVSAAPAAAVTPRAKPVILRIGSYGAAVRDLQRELRRRGIRVVVDGAFGPATKRAVKRIQKRFKMKPTGVANAKLLKRLGLQVRVTAGATAPVAPTVTPGRSPYLDVFPVVGEYTYSDDFGAARHQGRHEGVDIMADRNTPIVAVVNGTVERLTRTETGLGGIYVWLQRSDGTEYYYAHMNSIATGLEAGQQVSAGQVIGAVGNTGDARYGATHLHFEIRPGGTPTDPYPHLVAVDPTAR
jgi:murein DD-endopeptidase MepM/ murein hydrolase activator NlpD